VGADDDKRCNDIWPNDVGNNEVGHVANQHDADGLSERTDAAPGIGLLSLICRQNRNGSGAAVFLWHVTKVSPLSLAKPKGAES
jgi:hypothetical protein